MMVPDCPDVQDVLLGDDGVFANAKAGHARHRLLQHPPGRDGRARRRRPRTRASGCSTPRSPAAKRAPRRGALDHGRRLAEDFEAAKPVFDAVGKTIVHVGPQRRRPDRQGRQPAHRRRQHRGARRGDRLPRGLRRRHSRRPSTSSAAGSPAPACSTRSGTNMLARVLRARVPHRAAPQGHGHRDARRPRGRRRRTARRLVAQLMASAAANGDGGLDHSGLLRGVERLSGRLSS